MLRGIAPAEHHAHTTEDNMSVPKSYRSIQEFEREEIRSHMKIGFSLDDLHQDATFDSGDLLFDDTVDEYDPEGFEVEDD